jgi:prevent-host-death family protein
MDARITEFGSAEAKARFSELLARVEAGETIIIRRHGNAVAKLVPAHREVTIEERRAAHRRYLEWSARHGPRLGPGLTIKQLIDEGRP